MAIPTPNLGLTKPEMSDEVDQTIPSIATNFGVIDAAAGKLSDLTTTVKTSLVSAISENANGLVALKADFAQYEIDNDATVGLKASTTYVDAELLLKADQTSLNTTNANVSANATAIAAVASGSPKGTYATLTALQTALPTGNTNIYVVTADGNWYYWNGSAWTAGGVYQSTGIADSTVGLKQSTSAILTALNVNEYNVTDSLNWEVGAFATATGAITSSTTRLRTVDFIYAEKDTIIQLTDATNYQFRVFKYSVVDESFIAMIDWTTSSVFTRTLDADYLIKLAIRKPTDATLTSADIPTAIASFVVTQVFVANGENGVIKGETIITANDTDFLLSTTTESDLNLFDKTAVTLDGYYDDVSLAWVSNVTFNQSEFIPVVAGDVITISSFDTFGSKAVFKDVSGVIFAGITIDASPNPRSFAIPSGATQVSINLRKAFQDTLMLVKNRTFPITYVSFGKTEITDEKLKVSILDYVEANLILPSSDTGRYTTANFLGDSITWGYSPVDGTQLPTIWVDLVKEELGMSIATNYGISGSTITDYTGDGTTRNPMCVRYTSMSDPVDLVFVLGGTNDWANNVTMGSITDSVDTTFYGALNTLVNGLLDKYPTQTIVLATPLHRQGDTVANSAGATLNAYRNAVIAIGEKFGVAVLDLYATSGLYPDNATNYTNLVPDGRHPNEAGHTKLSKRIAGFLRTL